MGVRQSSAAELIEAIGSVSPVHPLFTLEYVRKLLVVVHTEDIVDLRNILRELRPVALSQAAAHHELRL